jgi:hypothetical protein
MKDIENILTPSIDSASDELPVQFTKQEPDGISRGSDFPNYKGLIAPPAFDGNTKVKDNQYSNAENLQLSGQTMGSNQYKTKTNPIFKLIDRVEQAEEKLMNRFPLLKKINSALDKIILAPVELYVSSVEYVFDRVWHRSERFRKLLTDKDAGEWEQVGLALNDRKAKMWAKEVGASATVEKAFADASKKWSSSVNSYSWLTRKEWNDYQKSPNSNPWDKQNEADPAKNAAKTSKRPSLKGVINGIRQYRRPSDAEVNDFARKQHELLFKDIPHYKPLPKTFTYMRPL